jgi:uncharacterized protein YgiM (DUF1202 family)
LKRALALCFLALSAALAFASPALAPNEAFVIMHNLPLWTEKAGAKLEWKENLVIGDRLTLLNRTAKFKQDGREREYSRVKAPSGAEGWVRSSYIAPKASLAVIKAEKAIVYSEPRDVKMTAKTVSFMTIVAVVQDGGTVDFAKIVAYDAAQEAYYTDPVYVSRADLSFADADLNAVILFNTAKGTKDTGIRQNFMRLIDSRYSSSFFYDAIKSKLSPAPAKATQPASGSFVVNDDNVNLRASPDEVSGQVLSSLSRGAKVEVLEVTSQKYSVGGVEAPWYKIKAPEGWVFGAFLSPAE